MTELLSHWHDGSLMQFFDREHGGEISSGEFLTTYLVSLDKARTVTCDEIMEKFDALVLR